MLPKLLVNTFFILMLLHFKGLSRGAHRLITAKCNKEDCNSNKLWHRSLLSYGVMNTHGRPDLLGETNLSPIVCYSARVCYLPSTICLLRSAAAPYRALLMLSPYQVGGLRLISRSSKPLISPLAITRPERVPPPTRIFYIKLLPF